MNATAKVLVAGALSVTWTALGLAAATFTLTRITDAAGCSREAAIDGTGRRIVFASEADHVPGSNGDANFEIFLFDRKAGFTQITNTTGGVTSGNPAVSANGRRIAFVSTADLVPGGNADGSQEIFLFDRKTGFRQITSGTAGSSDEPKISASGNQIVFVSDRDLVPGGNADANLEIFLFDRKKGLTQVTNTVGVTNAQPAINRSGNPIVFTSSADLVPGSNADASTEVFLFHRKKGFTQVTSTGSDCSNRTPTIAKSGARAAFASTCDLVPGHNADHNVEIFLFDRKKGFTQITETGGPENIDPAIDGRGKRIAFVSSHDLVLGSNADLNYEIFLFDPKSGFRQLSSTTMGSGGVERGPAITANGKRIAFELSGVPSGGANADGEGEIYVADVK